jgi:hypothetical protein
MREVWPPGERGGPPRNGTASPMTAAHQDRETPNRGSPRRVESLLTTVREAWVYGALWLAARRELQCPSDEEILELTSYESNSQPNAILRRLERRELIAFQGFQRGRQVEVLALGLRTAPPPCVREHWRRRTALQDPHRPADNDTNWSGDAA